MLKDNTINIEISAPQTLSYAAVCAGIPPILSVCAEGFCIGKRYDISLNIYGIGKNGFFIERTALFSRRLYAYDSGDGVGRLCFDLSGEKCRIKRDFFFNLKSVCSGSIYAELCVDGKKFLAQKSVDLLPKSTYSPAQSPSLLAYYLYPHTELTDRIAKSCSNNPEKLFDAVKGLGFIYSARNGEDGYGNYNMRLANELCLSGTKVAGALEAALFFASCALSCRLYPSLCVTEKGGIQKLLCGISHTITFDKGICDKKTELFRKASSVENPPVFFDITSLFAGYNIDFFQACKNGIDILADENLVFVADLIPCLEEKYPPVYDGVSEKKMVATLDAVRNKKPRVKTIESISLEIEKDNNALLNFDVNSKGSLHLCLSSVAVADKLARYTIPVHIKSVKGALDEERVAPLSAGICSLISSGKTTEQLNMAETTDISSDIAVFRQLLRNSEEDFTLSTLLSEEELLCRTKNISSSGNAYIACGFFRILGSLAPIALFPVTCDGSDITFTDTVPFANKLLAQHIITGIELDDFYKKFSLPEGSCESIVSYFENLALHVNLRANKKICEVVRESALSTFPVSSCRLLSSLNEDRERISSDPLVRALVDGESSVPSPDGDSLFSVYASRISQLEQTSPALSDSHLAALAASVDNDLFITADNGCGITDTAFAIACENLRLGKKTLIVCPEGSGMPRALKNKFERANLSCSYLSLVGTKSIKGEISKKLGELKDISPSSFEKVSDKEFLETREPLCDIYRKNSKVYPFGKSLYDLITEHEAHAAYLGEEEMNIHIMPEGLYLPDMSRQEYDKLFELSRKLCEVAYELCPSGSPLTEHPLISVKRTAPLSDTHGFMTLYEEASLNLLKLGSMCEGVISASGIDYGDLHSLSSLYSFISLILTVMTEYTETAQKLSGCDIYSIAKKIENARALMSGVQDGGTEKELSEVLCEIKRLFPENAELTCDTLERLSRSVSFLKSADIHAKKIFGTNSGKRTLLFSRFYDIYAYCNSNREEIVRIADCFEKLFDEKSGYASGIYSLMKSDIYGAHFADGILSAGGMCAQIRGWKDNISSLDDIVSYNVTEQKCEEAGLALFAKHIKNEGVSPETPHIFARSLIFLAANQIKNRERTQDGGNISHEFAAFSDAQKALSVSALYELSQIHISSCAKYINSNIQKTDAFSDSLSDGTIGSHKLLRRYCDIITGLFPIVFAHPEYAVCLDGFENVIFLGADRIPLGKALPIIPRAKHRMICAQHISEKGESLAHAARDASICSLTYRDLSYKYDSAPRSYFDTDCFSVRFKGAPKIRRLVTEGASYDKDTCTNIAQAQSICLDIIKLVDEGFVGTLGIAALSQEQARLIKDLLDSVCDRHEGIKNAYCTGRLNVFCTEDFCPDSFDICYISTLFAPSESGCAVYDYRMLSSGERVCADIRKAVSCARESLVVASSLFGEDISGYARSYGEWQILRLCQFAENKCPYTIPNKHSNILCESLCNILCEAGYIASPISSNIGAAIEHDGKTYAIFCEKTDSHTTFDREVCLHDKLISCGYIPIRVKAEDIMLHREKVALTVEKIIKKENTII